MHVLKVRHLDGYWGKVWSVHPLDLAFNSQDSEDQYGRPRFEPVLDNQVFVRGRLGRFRLMRFCGGVNGVLALMSLLFCLVRLVRRERIDVIRSGDPLLCGLLGLVVSRMTGARLMVRVNADYDRVRSHTGSAMMPRLFRSRRLEERIERLVLGRCDVVIGPTKPYIDFAVRKGAAPSRCHVVRFGNLIDLRHLVPVEDRPPIDDHALASALTVRPWLLYIGRLLTLKYVEDCIEVLALLRDNGSAAGLILVGEGPLQPTLEARASELGLLERVMFLGARDQDFLARLIPLCSVVLSPLTGRALSEAAFGEAAIVAYDLDWHSELIVDGVSGFLVEAENPRAMAAATAILLSDRNLSRRFGRAARARAFEILDPHEQTRLEVAAYRRLVRLQSRSSI